MGMAFWVIAGGAVLGAWAMLSVVGGELTRRTREMESRVHATVKRDPAQE